MMRVATKCLFRNELQNKVYYNAYRKRFWDCIDAIKSLLTKIVCFIERFIFLKL